MIKLKSLILLFVLAWGFQPALGFKRDPYGSNKIYLNQKQETVYYNTQSHIFHRLNCVHAQRCTRNCILINKAEAILNGRPCRVCGG